MIDTNAIETAVKSILIAIGEDPERAGLKETPARVARFWQEFAAYQDDNIDTVFEEPIEPGQSMVVLSGVRVWSLCEHHLLPFTANVHMAYIPNGANGTGAVLGISKLARIARLCSSRLQVQERMAAQIADEIERATGSKDVAVLCRGVHTCMTMRGIKSNGVMSTSVMRGAFRDNHHTRVEFLSQANENQGV